MAQRSSIIHHVFRAISLSSSYVFALALMLLLSACSDDNSSQQGNAGGGAPGGGQAQPVPVGFITVSPEKIGYTEKLPGRVVSYRVAQIRPQVGGIIQARLFEEGSLVEEGEQLYQIDPERYEADLAMAQANLESATAAVANAQSVVDRYDGLAAKKVLSEQEFDNAKMELQQAKASVSQAEAEVKSAKINLAYTKVYAPISGFIGPSSVTKGALVTQQQQAPLAVIRQLDPVYVDLSQSVSDAQQLKARLIESRIQKRNDSDFSVSLFFSESGEPYPHKGKLDATDLAVNEQTGAIRIRSVFPNPDNRLLPGLFVRAAIEDLASSDALVVPQKSVQIGRNGAKHVWVVANGNKAAKRAVKTGVAYKDKWIIEEGLQKGDKVIVEGTMTLRDGAPVKAKSLSASSSNLQGKTQSSAASSAQSGR
ncbi:efflux RND transporter periplasmic adaptor subunit [Alteromonas halophila]|uniref:MexE family multidrug efflux RND transporter periplasmic adaptor subunit n=1 Tax=Alteromonas halophila TaxID=516698 RepID=A0A918MY98_9ALTE|nr:efflux RND transporter periplasmic adaptor subunit [Alteromonas halophila]GGW87357.1 MexE family multidrug efflux RND transporter periplasmic adaptor subunit [Alteromonas halophila]